MIPASSSQLEGLVRAWLRVEATPTGAITPPVSTEEESMSTTPESCLTRAERLQLAAAALRGVLAGVARAVVSWLIDLIEEDIHH